MNTEQISIDKNLLTAFLIKLIKLKGKTIFKSLSLITTANLYFGNILSFFDSNVIKTCYSNV